MALSIILGLLAGFVGFLPLLGALRLTKKVTTTSNFSHMSALLLGVLVSFLLLFGAILTCKLVAPDLVFPFGVAEVAALSVTAIIFGVIKLVRK